MNKILNYIRHFFKLVLLLVSGLLALIFLIAFLAELDIFFAVFSAIFITPIILNIRKQKKGANRSISTNNPYFSKYDEKEIGLDNVVYLLYCDYADAFKWIKDAKKIDTYFSSYEKAQQILTVLCTYEWKYKFEKPLPSKQLQELNDNYPTYTKNFITRYWNLTLDAADKLKTPTGKQKRIQKFFNDIDTIKDRLPTEVINYILELMELQEAQKENLPYSIKVGNHTLNTLADIKKISQKDISAVSDLQKAATDFKRMGKMDMAIACLRKTNDISDAAPDPVLAQKNYLRLVKYIEQTGNTELAKQEEEKIYARHPEFLDKRISNLKGIKEVLQQNSMRKNDLVLINTNNTCPICSEYHLKVYSISGKRKKYPKLPTEVEQKGGFCPDCYMGLLIYYEGINSPARNS